MARKRADAPEKKRFGVEAELERLLACPVCGSNRVRPNKNASGGYGVFGFKAIGDLSTPRDVVCRHCGHEWLRPPLRELRVEAQRRLDERYEQFSVENQRLLAELERDRRTNFAPIDTELAPRTDVPAGPPVPNAGSTDVTPEGPSDGGPAN